MFAVRASGNASRLWVGQYITTPGWNDFYAGYTGSSGDEGTTSSYKHKLTSAEARFNTAVYESWISSTSDDRLKDNEELIESACETLSKLRPQTYDKTPSIENDDPTTWIKESGLLAQEVYYDAPELRHLV